MMRIRLCRNTPLVKIIMPVLAASAFCLSGCAQESAPPVSQPGTAQAPSAGTAGTVSPASSLIAEGEALFKEMCKSCHGSRGNGLGSSRGPSLQRKEFTHGRTREAIAQSIRGGRPGGMPSFGHVFSPRQLEAVSSYVMSLEK